MDWSVGQIIAALERLNLADNTFVFFTSDNGHELYYGPKPEFTKQLLPNGEKANLTDKKWRTSECGDIFDGAAGRAGLKRSGYQGGMQCPMIVRWPGHIEPGTTTGILSSHYDFMGTLADLVGFDLPKGKDSVSYLPTLLGKEQTQEHEYVFVNNNFNRMARTALITRQGWKLVEIDRKKDHFQLYNIKDDNQERNNLADKYPERVEKLKKILLKEIDSPRPDIPKQK